MAIRIFRVTLQTATCLTQVDPDVFDAEIDPDRTVAFLSDPSHLMAVAQADDLVVGQIRAMIHRQPDGPTQLYIDNLGVAPAWQRQGIATALLREVSLWGKDHGCRVVWVATEPDNEAALGLYNRFRTSPAQTVSYFEIALGTHPA